MSDASVNCASEMNTAEHNFKINKTGSDECEQTTADQFSAIKALNIRSDSNNSFLETFTIYIQLSEEEEKESHDRSHPTRCDITLKHDAWKPCCDLQCL